MTVVRGLPPDTFLPVVYDGYARRKALITSATGIIGRRLVAGALDPGADVRLVLRPGHSANGLKQRGGSIAFKPLQGREDRLPRGSTKFRARAWAAIESNKLDESP